MYHAHNILSQLMVNFYPRPIKACNNSANYQSFILRLIRVGLRLKIVSLSRQYFNHTIFCGMKSRVFKINSFFATINHAVVNEKSS